MALLQEYVLVPWTTIRECGISFRSSIDKVSEEGQLKCTAMNACFMLCLRKILFRRRSEEEINTVMDKITTLTKDIVQFCLDVKKESKEIGMIYAPFLQEHAKLLYEIIS